MEYNFVKLNKIKQIGLKLISIYTIGMGKGNNVKPANLWSINLTPSHVHSGDDWADVILAGFQTVIFRDLQNKSTYLFCTAENVKNYYYATFQVEPGNFSYQNRRDLNRPIFRLLCTTILNQDHLTAPEDARNADCHAKVVNDRIQQSDKVVTKPIYPN